MHDYRYSIDWNEDYIELVRQAQLGSKDRLDALSERFRGWLYAYVYRMVRGGEALFMPTCGF
jgi:hypothetical protein